METVKHLKTMKQIMSGRQPMFYDWMLEHGETFTQKDILPDHEVRPAVIKRCYINSVLLALIHDYEYYEGYYMPAEFPIPISHAFNRKSGSENIVDCTAQKFGFNVSEWYGIPVPKNILQIWLEEEQYQTPLEFYFRNYVISKKRSK